MTKRQYYYRESMPNTTKERVLQLIATIYSWWSRYQVIIVLTLVLSGMDGLVLYSVLDKAMTQAWYMGIIMAFGISVVLNLIPIFESKFVHRAIYKTHKYSKTLAVTAIVAFFILYAGTVYLRFAYEDMYGDVEEVSLTNNLVSESVQSSDDGDKKAARSRAIVVLLAIEPLATSICGFVLSFISDDELRRQIETLEEQIADLEYEIAWKKAAIASMKDKEVRLNMELSLDKAILLSEKDCVRAMGEALKARAREILAMFMKDPASISKLSFQMNFKNTEPEIKMYEYPTVNENLTVVANE